MLGFNMDGSSKNYLICQNKRIFYVYMGPEDTFQAVFNVDV